MEENSTVVTEGVRFPVTLQDDGFSVLNSEGGLQVNLNVGYKSNICPASPVVESTQTPHVLDGLQDPSQSYDGQVAPTKKTSGSSSSFNPDDSPVAPAKKRSRLFLHG